MSSENSAPVIESEENEEKPIIILGYDEVNKCNGLMNKLKFI